MTRALAIALTCLTGFSGLVYEVAWEKCLATLLGSHSEATAAVLGIFLGGLSVGYSIFGSITRRMVAAGRGHRLLVLYGVVEGSIGVYVLIFPALFTAARAVSMWFPQDVSGLGFALDVLLAAMLIGPPSVMMGGTIPILTQALSRTAEESTRFHALVYAVNTAGAFVGALAAGFFLIPALGLVVTMRAMGIINLVAGTIFGLMGLRRRPEGDSQPTPLRGAEPKPRIEALRTYAVVALLVGFAMMAVQTVLIRFGGLTLGASQFTFSMVVAVFVLCIALGSFGVSALRDIHPSTLALNQWMLFLLLLLLYGLLPSAPYGGHLIRSQFRDIDPAFFSYHIALFIALVILIGPAVLLSGASLPLLFHRLRGEVGDLGIVAGRLYSWNTTGSLLGAFLGGYLLLFWLDLDDVFRVALVALVVAAGLVTWRLGEGYGRIAGILTAFGLVMIVVLDGWEPRYLMQGLFRVRAPVKESFSGREVFYRDFQPNILFYEDDPTSSVAVVRFEDPTGPHLSIFTNAKSDGNTIGDYRTMGLAAIVPALFAERAERSFVIGFGTGITVGELASLPEMEEVVVSEISPGVMSAAPLFDPYNLEVSKSPKVRVIRSDAYRALLRSEGSYDVIVSEPSNPWVTGVEMLFSKEFLSAARDRLSPGGVYAQWLNLYETDDATLELVLRTYSRVFDRVSVWSGTPEDLIILGFGDETRPLDLKRFRGRAAMPAFTDGLARSDITSLPQLLAQEIVPLGVLGAAGLEGPSHTLLHPILGYRAARAFFRGKMARIPFTGFGQAARVGWDNSLLRRIADDAPRGRTFAGVCGSRIEACVSMLSRWLSAANAPSVVTPFIDRASRANLFGGRVTPGLVRELSRLHWKGPGASGDAPVPLRVARRATSQYARYFSHVAPFSPRALIDLWARCKQANGATELCERGMSRAKALVREGILPSDAEDVVGSLGQRSRAHSIQVPRKDGLESDDLPR